MPVKPSQDSKQRHKSGESTFSQDSISHYIPTPPDGGYGWIVVLASFINHVIVDGICFTFGVFYPKFLDAFQGSKGKTTLIGSLLTGGYLIAGPIASAFTNKFGCRPVCIAGGLLSSAAFMLSSFSPNLDFLILTYGFLGGLGFGFIYLPSVIAVSYYFDRKRALATGIAVCGAGVGTFIFAPLGDTIIQKLDWQNSLRILSAFTFCSVFCGILFKPLEAYGNRPRTKNLLDRLCERWCIKKPADAITLESEEQIAEKVKEAKLMRQERLRAEEPDLDVISSLPSLVQVQKTENGQIEPEVKTNQSNGCVPTIHVECNGDVVPANGGPHKAVTFTKTNGEVDSLLSTPKQTKLSFSENHLLSVKPKTRKPPGVHREDYARPLYRQDIFYSGSIVRMPQFNSQPNMRSYVASITAIPGQIDEESETCCTKLTAKIPKPVMDVLREMFNFKMLKDFKFLLICFANIIAIIGLYVPFIFLVERSIHQGINKKKAAFLISVIGIANTIGRVLAGWVADWSCVNTLLLHNISILLAGIASILSVFCNTYLLMCLYAACFGLTVATWISLTSIVLCELVSLEKLTNAFGILTMLRGIAVIAGPPIVALIYDSLQNYDISFYIGGGALILASLLLMLLFLPCFRKAERMEMTTEEIDEIFIDLDPTQNDCFMNNGGSTTSNGINHVYVEKA